MTAQLIVALLTARNPAIQESGSSGPLPHEHPRSLSAAGTACASAIANRIICTDPTLALQQVVQEYLWRWDIEVNFREEKTLLGVGQAQVRVATSVASVPALAVGAYALLQLAALETYGDTGQPDTVPLPHWRRRNPPAHATTGRLINQLRYELWAQALRPESYAGFRSRTPPDAKPEKPPPHLTSATFYAMN